MSGSHFTSHLTQFSSQGVTPDPVNGEIHINNKIKNTKNKFKKAKREHLVGLKELIKGSEDYLLNADGNAFA